MMPLIYAEKGQPQIIRKISGSPEVKQHLEDLGFHAGGQISVVSTLGENLIVKVKESRVAVSDELARSHNVSGLCFSRSKGLENSLKI